MKIGIVGTGFMGRVHATAWKKTPAILAGFLGRTPQSADQFAQQFGGQTYPGIDEMLAEVDVIDICTPTHLHHAVAVKAAAAGKHIVCEKPLARTLEQGWEMITASSKAGVKLLAAHVLRYFPQYAAAHKQVTRGTIGRPAILRLTRGSSQPKKPDNNWFLEIEKSGGMILDLMIHDFDYARWVAGEVETVFAQSIRHNHKQARVDHALVILRHRSGALSHIEGSWAYPAPLFKTSLEIAGDNGWLQYTSDDTTPLRLYHHETASDTPDIAIPDNPQQEDPYTTQIRSFYHHLAEDAPIAVDAADGLAALQIALAAVESAQTGQPVALPLITEVVQ